MYDERFQTDNCDACMCTCYYQFFPLCDLTHQYNYRYVDEQYEHLVLVDPPSDLHAVACTRRAAAFAVSQEVGGVECYIFTISRRQPEKK